MKLYHFPFSPNSRKVVAVLHYLNIECDLELLDLGKGEQLNRDFLALNPNHMIPTLADSDFILWESNAIMQYLCSKLPGNTLLPTDPRQQADVNRWLFWQTAHFGNACGILVFEQVIKPLFMKQKPDSAEIAKGEERLHRFAKVLNKHLQDRQWLVGDELTLADFSVASFLALAGQAKYPISDYQEIKRWYGGIEALPAWQSSADPK